MELDRILGNEGTVDALKGALAGGRLPHAVLLAGPDGCGRGFAARCLAADYLFPAGGPGAQAVLRGESPEVLLVAGEGKSGQIPVDAIRAVRGEVFRSALSAAGRVVWIRDAHRMAAPAYNALLKVLEEPPAGAVFLLTAGDAASLPPTILSRCALYPMAPVAEDICREALRVALPQGADPALPGMLSVLYGGRIGLGLAALKDMDRLAVVKDAVALAEAAAKPDRYALLRIFAAYEGRADGDREKREALLADLSDALEASLRGGHAPGLPVVRPDKAARLLPFILEARIALRTNAAAKITFTALSVHIAHAVEERPA